MDSHYAAFPTNCYLAKRLACEVWQAYWIVESYLHPLPTNPLSLIKLMKKYCLAGLLRPLLRAGNSAGCFAAPNKEQAKAHAYL
jgi:hypothetical protein